jgi:signal transduction histidine kinase
MLRTFLKSTLFLALVALPATHRGSVEADVPEYLPFRLEVHGNPYGRQFVVGDADGNGTDELLTIGGPEEGTTDNAVLWLFEGGSIESKWQLPIYSGLITDGMFADLEGDGNPELILCRMDGFAAWVEVYEASARRLIKESGKIPTPDRDGSGRWGGGFDADACFDLNGDNIKDPVVSLGGGRDTLPRCMIALSGSSLEILREFHTAGPVLDVFHYQTGPAPSDIIILVRTNAIGNKHVVGSFTDSLAYLFALDTDFQVLWYHQTVDFGEAWDFDVADLDSDGDLEVVFSRSHGEATGPTPYRIEVRDLRTNRLEKYRNLPAEMGSVELGDIDQDGDMEVLTALDDNSLRLYDYELNLIKQHDEGAEVRLRPFVDLDLDGSPEIVGRRGSTAIMIMDAELNHLARREFHGQVRKVDWALVDDNTRYLVAKVADYVHYMSLVPSPPPMIPEERRPIMNRAFWILVGILGGIGIGVLIGSIRFRSGKPSKKALEAARARDQLLSTLSAFGHSGVARSNLERLAQYCEAGPDVTESKSTAYQTRLSDIVETYHGFTRGLLEQIVVLCGTSEFFPDDSARLRRELESLNKSLPPGGARDALVDLKSEEISKNARAVRKDVLSLRKAVLASYRTDVIAATGRVVSAVRERLWQLGVREISTKLRGGGLAQVDEDALKTCVEILLVNAAEAMAGRAQSTVSVETDEDPDGYVFLRISDSGCGIASKDWERIFERDFTSKGTGHGLGLYHARQALGRYGGVLKVEKSEEGVGTVMVIRVTAVKDDSAARA